MSASAAVVCCMLNTFGPATNVFFQCGRGQLPNGPQTKKTKHYCQWWASPKVHQPISARRQNAFLACVRLFWRSATHFVYPYRESLSHKHRNLISKILTPLRLLRQGALYYLSHQVSGIRSCNLQHVRIISRPFVLFPIFWLKRLIPNYLIEWSISCWQFLLKILCCHLSTLNMKFCSFFVFGLYTSSFCHRIGDFAWTLCRLSNQWPAVSSVLLEHRRTRESRIPLAHRFLVQRARLFYFRRPQVGRIDLFRVHFGPGGAQRPRALPRPRGLFLWCAGCQPSPHRRSNWHYARAPSVGWQEQCWPHLMSRASWGYNL